MNSAEIRSRWLNFFESGNSQGLKHTVVPSASLIADDPNLLLVNAGMVPFKPFFLGEITPPYARATSVQKCVRTLDIDEVGKTTRHASFFQMCGNFSFGDYFKEGAIALAWELLTKPVSQGGYGFPEEKLWVTVFQNDD
ncbi:MAG: alanine--tRNA ligase, partial [Actinobacteria bacterium]|nr:alanine--tRNA ligase [Actinomycetota bacterium]